MSLLQTLLPTFNRPARYAQTGNGEPAIRPAYDLNETENDFRVTVELPGVAKDGLEVTAEDGLLTVVGRRGWKRPEGWTSLHRESADAAYRLTLRYDATVDVDKVQAELRDGILRLTLPKSEASKPRKITVA